MQVRVCGCNLVLAPRSSTYDVYEAQKARIPDSATDNCFHPDRIAMQKLYAPKLTTTPIRAQNCGERRVLYISRKWTITAMYKGEDTEQQRDLRRMGRGVLHCYEYLSSYSCPLRSE